MRHRPLISFLAVAAFVACSSDGFQRENEGRSERPRRYERARIVGRVRSPALTELSGIVAVTGRPDRFWVHNDSGGGPVVYCIERGGGSCGEVAVAGAEAVDWEDIASDRAGSLYIGDIGDNLRRRDHIVVYRLPEPRPPGKGEAAAEIAVRLVLRYPDGRGRDAEALLVHPTTRNLYVITKDPPGVVYRAGAQGGRMQRVGRVALPGFLSLVTAADIAPDGRHVLIGTYGPAFELSLGTAGPFDRIWRRPPVEISLPPAEQREAIAYNASGTALVTTSEGRRAPVVERRVAP